MGVACRDGDPVASGTETRLSQFTELLATAISNTESRDGLRRLVDEQAALHRIAALVAGGAGAQQVFDAVCAEAGRLVGATGVNLAHYTPDGFNVAIAGWSLRDLHVLVGARFPNTPDTVAGTIAKTHAPARIDDWRGATSELARLLRGRGMRSSVGAPIVVDSRLWGALVASTDSEEPLPVGTEFRLARFAELIATAISNAATHSELIASRVRIVVAGDEARRRIERNLHDATQQRLVNLGLDLHALRATVPAELHESHEGFERMGREIQSVLEEVRELSRGLNPALLARAGLGPSLRALARRSPIPVDFTLVDPGQRPSQTVETCIYYVVSEALANAAKHSDATTVAVAVGPMESQYRVSIEDDGVGGAHAGGGSGLVGLIDRVEALGGRLELHSPKGGGTRITIEIPHDGPGSP
jgi:signal transduction histidine kinase